MGKYLQNKDKQIKNSTEKCYSSNHIIPLYGILAPDPPFAELQIITLDDMYYHRLGICDCVHKHQIINYQNVWHQIECSCEKNMSTDTN